MNICTLLRSAAGLRRISYSDCRIVALRQYSIFQDFSKKLKGEIDSNPELKKSLKEFQDLKTRTKETAEHLYKHIDAAKGEAQARAKEVSSVIKERINVASEQVKETLKRDEQQLKAQPRESPKDSEAPSSQSAERGSDAAESQPHERAANGQPHERAADEQPQEQAQAHQEQKKAKKPSGFASSPLGSRIAAVAKEGYDLLAEEITSKRRRNIRPSITRSSATGLVPVAENKAGWRKHLDDVKEKVSEHPLFQRFKTVKQHPVVAKTNEIAEEIKEEIRDRWDTSDSPVVHKIQDLNDSLFGETASAAAMKEIRSRDPLFSVPDFVSELQEDVKPVLTAYLKGDFGFLAKRCSKGVVDRCRAEQRGLRSQGMFVDSKILYVSDVEVKEIKMLGNDPLIIVSFRTQQSYCVRDEAGKIKEGSQNDIRTVYYFWAMEPMELDPDECTPRWQLREMQQLGVQAII